MADPVSLDPVLLRVAADGGAFAAAARDPAPAGKGFGTVLSDLVREADEMQKASDQTLQGLGAGETEDVHHVMLAMAKADLSFKLMLEVRNKLLEAYQDVMRLQV